VTVRDFDTPCISLGEAHDGLDVFIRVNRARHPRQQSLKRGSLGHCSQAKPAAHSRVLQGEFLAPLPMVLRSILHDRGGLAPKCDRCSVTDVARHAGCWPRFWWLESPQYCRSEHTDKRPSALSPRFPAAPQAEGATRDSPFARRPPRRRPLHRPAGGHEPYFDWCNDREMPNLTASKTTRPRHMPSRGRWRGQGCDRRAISMMPSSRSKLS
jgi:hypothetical protein